MKDGQIVGLVLVAINVGVCLAHGFMAMAVSLILGAWLLIAGTDMEENDIDIPDTGDDDD